MITYERLTDEEMEQMEQECLAIERADSREREILAETRFDLDPVFYDPLRYIPIFDDCIDDCE